MSLRYDVPNAAPEPLRQVQLLLNTTNVESGDDWLPDWLAERGATGELKRARELREALRLLVLANNGFALPADSDALRVVNSAAERVRLRVDVGSRVHLDGGGDALAAVCAVALVAMLDGTWSRLKACRNCHWSFYDNSPNRSATWCSMQLCGNRTKTRAYRRRKSASR
ncbi:MAG: CGNR zinc finger domain-containing protein [Gaiellaceae bacterium]